VFPISLPRTIIELVELTQESALDTI